MTLDHRAFVTELQHLAERFNRDAPSPEMTRRYYQALRHVDTPTFLAAARQIYNADTFWPSPNRFLEAAGLDPATKARDAWQLVDRLARGTPSRAALAEPAREDPHLLPALREVGGLTAIARCDETRDLPHVARRFQAAYTAAMEQAATGRAQLEAPPTPALWTENPS